MWAKIADDGKEIVSQAPSLIKRKKRALMRRCLLKQERISVSFVSFFQEKVERRQLQLLFPLSPCVTSFPSFLNEREKEKKVITHGQIKEMMDD